MLAIETIPSCKQVASTLQATESAHDASALQATEVTLRRGEVNVKTPRFASQGNPEKTAKAQAKVSLF